MSKLLPPLPVELAAFANTGILLAALNDIVHEYGQQCREAAFDEAADYCDKLQAYPATEPRHCAEDIRILKNEQTTIKTSA